MEYKKPKGWIETSSSFTDGDILSNQQILLRILLEIKEEIKNIKCSQ
jgi:hypothetical protein